MMSWMACIREATYGGVCRDCGFGHENMSRIQVYNSLLNQVIQGSVEQWMMGRTLTDGGICLRDSSLRRIVTSTAVLIRGMQTSGV